MKSETQDKLLVDVSKYPTIKTIVDQRNPMADKYEFRLRDLDRKIERLQHERKGLFMEVQLGLQPHCSDF